MLIESYEIEVSLSSHSMEELEFEAVAYLNVDLRPVLPYLNAILHRAKYSPQAPALSWRYEGHKVGFWPDRIAVDHIHHKEEVQDVVEYLVELVNETWARRDQITPVIEPREFLQPLEILRLLPQTNCKLCGESTCFNFALQVAAGQAKVKACTPLFEGTAYEAGKVELQELLIRKSSSL
jgi:ArsR family metal-binding transcriptional regulator